MTTVSRVVGTATCMPVLPPSEKGVELLASVAVEDGSVAALSSGGSGGANWSVCETVVVSEALLVTIISGEPCPGMRSSNLLSGHVPGDSEPGKCPAVDPSSGEIACAEGVVLRSVDV